MGRASGSKNSPRAKQPGTSQSASLLNSRGMGGIRGGRGYAVQSMYAFVHLPLWLADKSFSSLMIEASGDVDVKFQTGDDTWRHYTQVKDRMVNQRILREVIRDLLSRRSALTGAYHRFTIAAKGFAGKVATFVEFVRRLRNAQAFFEIGGEEIMAESHGDLSRYASQCGLSETELGFVLDYVHFTELSGTGDYGDARAQVKGRLTDIYPTHTSQMLEATSKTLFELVTTSTGKELTRSELETAIEHAAASTPSRETGGRSNEFLSGITDSVRRGTLNDIDAPLKSVQAMLDTDPMWRVGVDMRPDGTRSISLSPRIPEALKYQPLRLRFRPSDPEKGNLMKAQRELYEGGDPVSLEANVELHLGERTLLPETKAQLRLRIPEDEVRHVPIMLRTTSKNGVLYEYFLQTEFRGHEGVSYGDNRNQSDSPVSVKLRIYPGDRSDHASLSTEFGISATGLRSAKQRLKYLKFTQVIAVERQPLSVFVLLGGEPRLLVTSPVSIQGLHADGLVTEADVWARVVALEEHLGTTFWLPEQLSAEEALDLEYLWNLLCVGFVEYSLDQGPTLTAHDVAPNELADLLLDEGQIQIGGETEPTTMQICGVNINLPSLEVTYHPVWLKNRDDVLKAVSEGRQTDLVFEPRSSMTVRETPKR